MSNELMGATFALLTALSWSVASLFFKRAGEDMHPIPLSIINCAVGLCLMVVMTLLVTGGITQPVSTHDLVWLLLSGALGIGAADTLYFVCINDIGAGRAAIVETAYSPLAVLGAYFYLHERMSVRDIVGAVLVVSGIVLVGWEARREDTQPVSKVHLIRGVAAGLLATAFFVTAIIGIKDIITHHDVRFAALIRMLGGLVATVLLALTQPAWTKATIAGFKPQRAWRYALPAGFFGMFLSMQLWVAGFKYAKASIAAVLNQTSSLFIVLLAALFLGEKLTPMKIAAVILGFAGSVLVVL